MDIDLLEEEVLSLSSSERARLAKKLLMSLDEISEQELDELWLSEASRRAEELDKGKSELIPAEEVREKAKALLK